ncbi:hypothetical protein [Rhodococcus sp. (in: high G+C Gram-positive bacteria)]|uniref:hypothetical protein n=1 Tax=Rhodococcus sp. TaxID=1831 RepID=UPI001A1D790B|nr:hypothetical protein [Rhodococcus sp. (in: high G+C Gram-positive bacteria)]MBJ7480892.1 hypothetical protein [Rhodococcus sp. (in: high G+C Gram-positive bacteria)]
MNKNHERDTWLTRYEAAERLSRSPRTITKWATDNNLESKGEGRYAKWRHSDLLRIKLQSEANKASGLFTSQRRPAEAGRPKPCPANDFDY